uniref:Ribosomal_L7Ae domain-containing protein n=1 Tax=Gongylonema pulchrum TaxID=637853 RepID=A0A183EBV4_9BILA
LQVKQENAPNGSERCIDNPFNINATDIDAAIVDFLKKVKHFQDRAWKENPTKANSKRRLVYGLREVRKQLNSGTAQCIIMAKDIETADHNELFNEIDVIGQLCASQNVNMLWISSKHSLGKAVKKFPFVSAVAVCDFRGAEDLYEAAVGICEEFTACCRIADHVDQPSLFA